MDKRIFLTVAFVLLLFGCAFAGNITRSFSSATVQPGAELTVTLAAGIDPGETFYIIDELLPSGWAIKDAGTGSAEHAGHLKWVVIQNASNTAYTYTLTAPSQAGTATFSGTYMFEGMENEAQISGQNQAVISQSGTTPQGNEDLAMYALLAVCAIVIIVAAAILLKKKKK